MTQLLKVVGQLLMGVYCPEPERKKMRNDPSSQAKKQARQWREVTKGILQKLLAKFVVSHTSKEQPHAVQVVSPVSSQLFTQIQETRYRNGIHIAADRLMAKLNDLSVETFMKDYSKNLQKDGAFYESFALLSNLQGLGKRDWVQAIKSQDLYPSFCLNDAYGSALLRENQDAAKHVLGVLRSIAETFRTGAEINDSVCDRLKGDLLRRKPGLNELLTQVNFEVATVSPTHSDFHACVTNLRKENGPLSILFGEVEARSRGTGEQQKIAQRLLDVRLPGQSSCLGALFGHRKERFRPLTNDTLRRLAQCCSEAVEVLTSLDAELKRRGL